MCACVCLVVMVVGRGGGNCVCTVLRSNAAPVIQKVTQPLTMQYCSRKHTECAGSARTAQHHRQR